MQSEDRRGDAHSRRAGDARIDALCENVDALAKSVKEFQDEYGPILRESLSRKKFWERQKDAAIEKGVSLTVWGFILACAAGLLIQFKQFILKIVSS